MSFSIGSICVSDFTTCLENAFRGIYLINTHTDAIHGDLLSVKGVFQAWAMPGMAGHLMGIPRGTYVFLNGTGAQRH
jgi:hypothetical protein